MSAQPYLPWQALVDQIDEPAGARIRQLLDDHRGDAAHARGSSVNHQAWPGGFWDHLTEVLNIAVVQYVALSACRLLPFSLSDALLVLCAHDLEKLFKFDRDGRESPALQAKADKAMFRHALLNRYDITLTPEQANALRYAEGVRDREYSNRQRLMGPLAAFVHCCDVLSSRMWFNYPLSDGDPWLGAHRSHPDGSTVTVPVEALEADGTVRGHPLG